MLNLPRLSKIPDDSLPKMTKKASIFKTFGEYFKAHPAALIAWLWVTIMPGIGSLILLSEYDWLYDINLTNKIQHTLFTLALACLMGLALLPTTLTSIAMGYFFGWWGLPDLLIAYVLANFLGYYLGSKLNIDFLPILQKRNPELKDQLDKRAGNIGELIFFIRISPLIPFAISNFLFATLDIDLTKVIRYGIPGMLPRTLIAFGTGLLANSFLDAKKSMNDPVQWVVLVILLTVSFWGLARYWKIAKS